MAEPSKTGAGSHSKGNSPASETSPNFAPVVEVDADREDDLDSTYGDASSFTDSLTSSIRNHTYENGRRYHAFRSGSYLAPNDDKENDRLDMHHHLATLLLNGKLHVAPIGNNPQRILDAGCGTGIWSIDIGEEYPSAQVIGIDLSPTQPTLVPPNVQFEVDDIEEDWTFSAPFDLVHVRFMACSIANWPKLVNQAFTHTKPGGWCEFKDFDLNVISSDGTLPADSYLLRYHSLVFEALDIIKRDYAPGPKLKDWVVSAGYANVHEDVLAIPIGVWPKQKKYKEIGAWNLVCLDEGLEAIALRLFTSILGWETEEVVVLLAHVRNELKDRRIHAQYTYHVVYGQKPGVEKEKEK